MIINIFATDIFASKPGWLGWVAGFAGRLGNIAEVKIDSVGGDRFLSAYTTYNLEPFTTYKLAFSGNRFRMFFLVKHQLLYKKSLLPFR